MAVGGIDAPVCQGTVAAFLSARVHKSYFYNHHLHYFDTFNPSLKQTAKRNKNVKGP